MSEARKPDGTWPEHCEQRAFVDGAQWWQFHANGATAFPSERDEMEAEAVKRYGEPFSTQASSGQAALVQRLRDAACDARLSMKPVSLLTEAADALSTASPAPACASCLKKDGEINRLAFDEMEARDRLEAAEASLQAQSERIAFLEENAVVMERLRDQIYRRQDELHNALVKVRAHTSYLPGAELDLLAGLLASVERIAEAALKGQ